MKRAIFFLMFLLPIFSYLGAEESSFTLSVSPDKGKVIEEIITTIGKTSVLSLGFKQGHLKALGKQLSGIGPLQFLAYIFSHEELTNHMKSIRKSSFKWNGVIDGLKGNLTKEADSNVLFSQLPGFAKVVQADYAALEKRAKDRNWDEFVAVIVHARSEKHTASIKESIAK
jgi:hypothetical protein